MLFYFVRHGQTEANLNNVLAGSGIDSPLTPEGHSQAQRVAQVLRHKIPHPLHRLIVSNMTRTQQTASYIAQELGLKIELAADFREWQLGEWEGRPYDQFAHLILGDGEPTQGESRRTFFDRVEKGWKEVHHETEPYLIVSHGGVWLALQDTLKIPRVRIDNCQLVRVEAKPSAQDFVWAATALT